MVGHEPGFSLHCKEYEEGFLQMEPEGSKDPNNRV